MADEFGSIEENKRAMAERMRDVYAVLFTSGLDLEDAFIGARVWMDSPGWADTWEGVPDMWPVVYKTWMSKEAADQLDWENKEAIDFDEVWKVVKIHHTYR